MLHVALKAFHPAQAAVPAAARRHDLEVPRDDRVPRRDRGAARHRSASSTPIRTGWRAAFRRSPRARRLHTQVMKTEALRQALDNGQFRRGLRRRAARRGKEPRQGAHLLAPLGRATPGTRATSGPNCGGCSTPAFGRANRCASSRCRTGPNSTSGNTSAPKTFPWCRFISPRSGRSSSATAR